MSMPLFLSPQVARQQLEAARSNVTVYGLIGGGGHHMSPGRLTAERRLLGQSARPVG